MRRIGLVLLVVAAVSGLSGCATPPEDPVARAEFEEINDPFEPVNRFVFEWNRFLDFIVLRPVGHTYKEVVPEYGRDRVSNVLSNLSEVMTLVNTLLQGRFDDSWTTLQRFAVNTTLGVGGIFDVATEFGLDKQRADFGETLYVWGVPEGPYVVLPLLGPATTRAAVGYGVDAAADPVRIAFAVNDFNSVNYGRTGGRLVDEKSRRQDDLDALERTSVDYYAQLRSVYRQFRREQLGIEEPDPFESFDNGFEDYGAGAE